MIGEKFMTSKIPFRWRKVGEISELFIFPVKSCGPIALDEIDCGLIGPTVGHLRDRVFVVTRSTSGEFVSARTYPKMVRIIPTIEDDKLSLTAEDMDEIVIDISSLHQQDSSVNVKIWADDAECVDCGDEVAQWLSKFILGENEGLRLLFYPSNNPKPVINDRNSLFEQANQKDTGALHDETSFMMMNQSSFDELNTKIDKKVTPLQYRPNFVVKGPEAWEEDSWKWVKIGDTTIFRYVQPCIRCIFTNIDPGTGERNPKMEPLKTLKTFRVDEKVASGPMFGIHLGVRKMGSVKVGDEVYVGE